MQRALVLVLALGLSGCVSSADVPGLLRLMDEGPSAWAVVEESSMAPDFTGMGETYPVLLVHTHHVRSERQEREARENPVVCLDLSGLPIPLEGAEDVGRAAMAPCPGPAVDPATGRLFVERARFDEADPLGVAVYSGACAGGAVYLGAQRGEFQVSMPGHAFGVRILPNGTFAVDDRWVRPGTALKIGYYLHRGDAMDEEYVRVVFDAPGGWLVSRVGPQAPGEPPLPPRPDMGTGLLVDVPAAAASLGEPIRLALQATPGDIMGISALRLVHDGARLTEVTLRVATEEGAVTWYGAGRVDESVRLLGAQEAIAEGEPALAVEAVLAAFDRPWAELRAGAPGEMTDARLVPEVAWASAGAAPITAPLPLACEGTCVHARGLDGAWARMLAPQEEPAQGALTLAVLSFAAEGDATEVWWYGG